METGTISFDVKMTEKAMFDFFLYHTYSSLSGILGVVFGFATLLFGIRAFNGGDQSAGMILLFFTFFFWIFTPVDMKIKAKRQVQKTPMFQKVLHYEMGEEGIEVSQDGEKMMNPWKEFGKATATSKCIIIYVTKVRALIFPKECLGEQYEAVVKMISTHMPPAKVKIRHVR